MRHRIAGKQLSRTTSHRVAMRRNMAASLFEHGAIRTTEPKAKELRRFVDRLITLARKGTLHARRQVISLLQDRLIVSPDGEVDDNTVVQKLFSEIAPRYVDRPGGYTRIIRLHERRIGDGGSQVILQLVEESAGESRHEATGQGRRRRHAEKRHAAVKAALKGKAPAEAEADEEPAADEPEEQPEAAAEQPADEAADQAEVQTDAEETVADEPAAEEAEPDAEEPADAEAPAEEEKKSE